MLRKAFFTLLLTLVASSPTLAQQWARDMFKLTNHDFGYLARGAKAEFEFEIDNIYVEDVHITSVRSSCGCTSPRIKQSLLKTYEKGAIIAKVNTDTFLGRKGATLTVTFDKPFLAEVQLHVTSYIRSDVVLQPGSVNLGDVNHGTACDKQISISYAGRSDWNILEVRSANPHLHGEVIEAQRGGGRVIYNLKIHLDEGASTGYIQDHLVLVTNDRRATQVTVPVEGRILSNITVSPASLFMGVVEPGKKVTKQLVIRSTKPFRVLSITCDGAEFTFNTSAKQTPKPLHLIPVTFVAGTNSGKIMKTIRIETDLDEETPHLSAYAVVASH